MRVSHRIAVTLLVSLIASLVGCRGGPVLDTTAAVDQTPLVTVIPTEPVLSDLPGTVGTSSPQTPTSPTQLTPSPTPWITAFSRVTENPVIGYWWSRENSYLHYKTADNQIWQYDPATGETKEIDSEVPVYGQPLPSVLSRIPEGVSGESVYFAPSGTKVVFAVVTFYYEEGTPGSDMDGERHPVGSSSELWYVTEGETEPRQLGVVDGTAYHITWSEDESRLLLVLVGHRLFPCSSSTGWLIEPEEGQMREVFQGPTAETPVYDACSFQIAPDGRSVFFYRCTYGIGQDTECEYYIRFLGEDGTYQDEPVRLPLTGQPAWLLPNNRGLLVTDGILVFLYGFEAETWLQLNTWSPSLQGAVPMDPPGETTRVIRFSHDAHYMAWQSTRGLQVFSLCPRAGELLDCE